MPGVIDAPEVFISASSADYIDARKVYAFLCARNIPTFFSDESIPALGETDYKLAIDAAIEAAHHLVVVTSSRANVDSKWVTYEWNTFANEQLSGRKHGNLLTIVAGNMRPSELPLSLRQKQVLSLETELDKLLHYVRRGTSHGPARPFATAKSVETEDRDEPRSHPLSIVRETRTVHPETPRQEDAELPLASSTRFVAEVASGPTQNTIYELRKDRVLIGRSPDCDIALQVPKMSRYQGQFVRGDDGYSFEDLGSSNGCFINGHRVNQRTLLHDGDHIHAGAVILIYRQTDASG